MSLSFLKRLIIFSALIAVGAFAWNSLLPPPAYAKFIWYIFIFFNGIAIASHLLILKALQKRGAYFVKFYMGMSLIRMFLYMAIVLAVILLFRPQAMNFTFTFLAFYMLYTAFEVITLMRKNKSERKF